MGYGSEAEAETETEAELEVEAEAEAGEGDDDRRGVEDEEGKERRRRSLSGASDAAVAAAAASELYCKVRHGENRYGCTLRFDDDGATGTVVIDSHDQGLAAGGAGFLFHSRQKKNATCTFTPYLRFPY